MSADRNRVLITGGAGFVGASLAVALVRRHPDWELVALDNLHRRGSELNLPRLERAGVDSCAPMSATGPRSTRSAS